jgi:hypothetical protein
VASARHGLLGGLGVTALGELLDDLGVERRQVVRLAAGDEAVLDHDFLIGPVATGVEDVGAQARPRRDGAARTTPASTSIPGPWQMTPTGLPCSKNWRTSSTAFSSMRIVSGLPTPPGITSAS